MNGNFESHLHLAGRCTPWKVGSRDESFFFTSGSNKLQI